MGHSSGRGRLSLLLCAFWRTQPMLGRMRMDALEYRSEKRSPRTGKASARQRPRDQWPVLIQGHHQGYVSWEEYMQTQKHLRQNWQRHGSPGVARQVPALLQGIVWCGHCGHEVVVQNHTTKEKHSSD